MIQQSSSYVLKGAKSASVIGTTPVHLRDQYLSMKFSGLSQKDQGNQAPGPVDHKGNGEAPCPKM